MPIPAKRGPLAPTTLRQQHSLWEAVDPGVQTFTFQGACPTIEFTNIKTPLSGNISLTVNGTTTTLTPGQVWTYYGGAVVSFTANTTVAGKYATLQVLATE